MKKITKIICCVGLLFLLNGTASAALSIWTGDGGDNLWNNAANWADSGVNNTPTIDNIISDPLVNMDVATTYTDVLIGVWSNELATVNIASGGYLHSSGRTQLGWAAGRSGRINMTGGTYDGFQVQVGYNGTGTLNMDGGLMIASTYLSIGHNAGSAGFMNMTAGEVRTDLLAVGYNGAGTVILSGGEINVNYFGTGDGLIFDTGASAEGLLDLTGGTLNWMNGDYTAEVNAFVLSGDIIASGAGQSVSVFYDSGANATVVTAIPEPATLGMLVALGGAMVWIRRRFMI